MTDGFKRALALGAATVALAGGTLLSSVGVASATPSHHGDRTTTRHVDRGRCHMVHGHWTRTWHPAWRDRHGVRHPGYWTRTWHREHLVCRRH
ncbi:hypothetical protein OHS81_00640 [Streptomyces sp. NBC_00400]|uniref:hypothetical protein n=1 Tax=Streptomyces sp. NBC_00400 TaxID=2975737 RepID=UPI002E1F4FFB